jgi:hypothetical protein
MTKQTRVKGHTLLFEGDAIGRSWELSGPGIGKCSCGEKSETLKNRATRKRWHREHKMAVLRLQGKVEDHKDMVKKLKDAKGSGSFKLTGSSTDRSGT